MSIKKDIIYPIFLKCCEFTIDEYWKHIFEDLAYGITPSGTFISKDCICCNYKKKQFSYIIEKKDPQVIYNEVYELFSERMGILSQRERFEKNIAFGKINNDLKKSRANWSDIRKKNIRDTLIQIYVARKKDEFNLTIKQCKYLYVVIFIAMIFKIISAKNIHYNDGELAKIDGINFKNKQVIFDIDIYPLDVGFNSKIVMEQKMITDVWDKYLENLQKLTYKK